MMNDLRERVAQAIYASDHDGSCEHKEWEGMKQVDQELYLRNADAAISTVREVAGENGWQMRPDEVTREMAEIYGEVARAGPLTDNKRCVFDRKAYHAMNEVAPKFEWG